MQFASFKFKIQEEEVLFITNQSPEKKNPLQADQNHSFE